MVRRDFCYYAGTGGYGNRDGNHAYPKATLMSSGKCVQCDESKPTTSRNCIPKFTPCDKDPNPGDGPQVSECPRCFKCASASDELGEANARAVNLYGKNVCLPQ